MDNLTDDCDPRRLFVSLVNASLDARNLTSWCENATEEVTAPSVLDDDLYWERVLPKLRLLYIEEIYGEYYKLVFYFSLVVCIVGYVTNVFNVIVLSSTPMAHSMNLFLLVLSVADIFHITTQFSHIVHYLLGFKLFPGYQWVAFYIWNTYFETMFLYMTNWLAVCIGAWRYIAITWPLRTREWCSKGRAKIVILVILLFSVLLATPIFVIITYRKVTVRSRDVYDKVFSDIAQRHDGAFLKTYWALLLFMGFVPCTLLAVLTFGLFRSLYMARAKRRSISDGRRTTSVIGSHRTTIMLTIILIFYFLSNFPDGCIYVISLVTNADETVQAQTRHFTDVIRIFMLSNNSAGFFIYYGLGEGFRTRFHRAFCCCIFNRLSRQRDESAKTTTSDLNRSGATTTSECRSSISDINSKGPTTVL